MLEQTFQYRNKLFLMPIATTSCHNVSIFDTRVDIRIDDRDRPYTKIGSRGGSLRQLVTKTVIGLNDDYGWFSDRRQVRHQLP